MWGGNAKLSEVGAHPVEGNAIALGGNASPREVGAYFVGGSAIALGGNASPCEVGAHLVEGSAGLLEGKAYPLEVGALLVEGDASSAAESSSTASPCARLPGHYACRPQAGVASGEGLMSTGVEPIPHGDDEASDVVQSSLG